MPLSKTLYLAQWVSNSIKSNVGNYVNTKDLYQNYKDHTLRGAHLPQKAFSKQLESAMNSFNIKPARSRFKKRRGYLGIECIDLPLSS